MTDQLAWLRLAGRAVIDARRYEALALLDLAIYPTLAPGEAESADAEWVRAVRLLLRAVGEP